MTWTVYDDIFALSHQQSPSKINSNCYELITVDLSMDSWIIRVPEKKKKPTKAEHAEIPSDQVD